MDENKAKKSNMFPVLTMAVIAVALIIVIVVVVANKSNTNSQGTQTGAANKVLTQENVYRAAPKPDSKQLEKLNDKKAVNSETKAWLYIPGTKIDDPVVQGADNSKYKTTGADNKANSLGAYYFDFTNTIDEPLKLSQNTVIYGSDPDNSKSGRMFSQLLNFIDYNYAQKNQYIYLTTTKNELRFRVIAAFYTKDSAALKTPNPTLTQLNSMTHDAILKSRLNFQTGNGSSDKYLTLYTTSQVKGMASNVRFVVLARLIYSTEKVDNTTKVYKREKYWNPDRTATINAD